MSRIFVQELDRIRVVACDNRVKRRWVAAYSFILFSGLLFIVGFTQVQP